MTTDNGFATIIAIALITEDSRTMKVHDEVVACQGAFGDEDCKRVGVQSPYGVAQCQERFLGAPRAQPPGMLDAYEDFLLEGFLRHDGNADVVH